MQRIVRKEIRQLKRDAVLLKPHNNTKSVAIIMKDPHRLVLRQRVVIDFQFFSESGEDVTTGRGANRDIVRWVLRRKDGEWLLHDSVVTHSKVIKSGRSA